MDDKELQALQEKINKSMEQITKQAKHYAEAITKIRKLIEEYFFTIVSSETQKSRVGSEGFYPDQISQLKYCLPDVQNLIEIAQKIARDSTPSLAAALDTHVFESGLPLIRHKNGYALTEGGPSNLKESKVMEQFIYALNLYRLTLSIFDGYHQIADHYCLDTEPHQTQLEAAKHLAQELTKPENPDSILVSWQKVKQIKHALNRLVQEIQQFTLDLQERIEREKETLNDLLKGGAFLLQEGYKKFPNTSKLLWVLADQEWQSLLKNIANEIFWGKYSSNAYANTLTINLEFSDWLKPIDEFQSMVTEQLPILKKELLKRAYTINNESITNLRIEAACKDISLIEAPAQGFFGSKTSVYAELLSLLRGDVIPRGLLTSGNTEEDTQTLSS
ncbi:coiled-coil protein [Legionella lansingensis]|uniref:Coiled-coil protein n=1 Tax=Legionella lansingensis TaxID=45067 RepID=A0A0W0VLE2_9GAMM|nr:hypothetical protein [Legionella lansingensis]KTD20888.1 coiled-coil protein [Legionella lansingensis]SNV43778.1 coiled-coil protein [Legionella lansingensis]